MAVVITATDEYRSLAHGSAVVDDRLAICDSMAERENRDGDDDDDDDHDVAPAA